MYLLGIDPGFAAVGYALVELLPVGERVEELGVLLTEKSGKVRAVRASDDNVRRGREIDFGLWSVASSSMRSVVAICAESMSFPRHAGNAAKMAMCWGVIVGISARLGIPIVQASPQEVKKAVVGKKDASKEEVQAALKARYPCPATSVPFTKTRIEHPFDALGAVVACLDSEVVRLARKMC